MARVTGTLPAPTSQSTTGVTWADASVNYGDVAALAETAPAILRDLRVLNQGSNLRRFFLRIGRNTTESDILAGPHLTDAWEGSAVAITLQAPTLGDLVIVGPTTAGLLSSDMTEPYDWRLSVAQGNASYANGGVSGWLSDFDGLTAAQQANVTYILDDGVPVAEDHAVDAGAASFAFATPEPTVTLTAAPPAAIALADFDTDGLEVEFLALLERPNVTDTRVLYADPDHGPDPAQSPIDGELGLSGGETVISRIFNQTNANLTLNDRDDPVALDIGAYLSTNGDGNDLTLWFQRGGVARQGVVLADATVSGGGNFVNIACPTALKTLLNAIAVGDQYLFGGTRPESTGTDHAVDAGAAAWAFAAPEPEVTKTEPAPEDHAVNAGGASWAFALPEPGVTRTAPGTVDHAVDAGEASWAFALPQPSITSSGVAAALDVLVRGVRQDGVQQPSIRVRHAPSRKRQRPASRCAGVWMRSRSRPTGTRWKSGT